MNKFFKILVFFVVSTLFVACSDSNEESAVVIGSDIFPEELISSVDSYSKGIIPAGEPVVVRFSSTDILKVKKGEEIPSDVFDIQPKLKGKPFWIDELTIGFPTTAADKMSYTFTMNFSPMFKESVNNPLVFTVGIRRQNFIVSEPYPICDNATEMSYRLFFSFSNAITESQFENFISKNLPENLNFIIHQNDKKSYDVEIGKFNRSSSSRTEKLSFNGESIGVDKTETVDLMIYNNDVFKAVAHRFDNSTDILSIFFTKPLNAKQNHRGMINSNRKSLTFSTSAQQNQLNIFIDKSSIWSSQRENVQIVVNQFVQSKDGSNLAEFYSVVLNLNNEKLPEVRWQNNGSILSSDKNSKIFFEAKNLNYVTLRIAEIYDNNVLHFIDDDIDSKYSVKKSGRLIKKVKVELENPTEEFSSYLINLHNYIDVKKGVFYNINIDFDRCDFVDATEEMKAFEVKSNEEAYWNNESDNFKIYCYDGSWNDPTSLYYYNYVNISQTFIVSDLGLTVKNNGKSTYDVFVNDICTAKPLANIEVKGYNFQKQEVASAKTDKKGFCQLKSDAKVLFVVAEDASCGKSYVVINNGKSLSYSKFDVDGQDNKQGFSAFVYSNRDIWRPGDEIQLSLMLSDPQKALPKDYPVVLTVYNARGSQYIKTSTSENVNGIYRFDIPTKPEDETGDWTAVFTMANTTISKSLKVETVKPNRLDINMELPKLIKKSSKEVVPFSAKWMNGVVSKNLKTIVDAKVFPIETTFENFKNYKFGNIAESYFTREMEIFNKTLNEKGESSLSFESLEKINSNSLMRLHLHAKVFEPSGEFSEITRNTVYASQKHYIGVSYPEVESRYGDYYFTNKNNKFDVVVVNADGTLKTELSTLTYKLYRVQSYWWWSSDDYVDFSRYVSGKSYTPYREGTVMCNGKISLTINIPDNDWGTYLLVVSNDESTFAQTVSFDWENCFGHSTSSSEAPALLTLKSSKEQYEVGEEVVVTFPSNDEAVAVVTVESNNIILQREVLTEQGSEGVARFKATEDMLPNCYVYLSLIQPKNSQNDMPIRMYGVIPVTISNKKQQLRPEIVVPSKAKTQETITVEVKEQQGRQMTYTLGVADEGILALTNFKTPSPYDYFNKKQALNVRTWDNYNMILSAFTGVFSNIYAVGGDAEGEATNLDKELSKRFSAFSATYGPFELKAGETNKMTFTVPQCSGRLRFMVVAKDGEKNFGSTEKKVNVVDPIVFYPAMPRVVSSNDEVTLSVQVLAPELGGKTVAISTELKNLTLIGTMPSSVTIDSNGEALLQFRARVNAVKGNAVVTVKGVCGKDKTSCEVKMPIRVPESVVTQHRAVEVAAGATETLEIDVQGVDGTLDGTVTVGTTIPLDIFPRLDYLMSYPHGCLEQITSCAFAQLYINDIVELNANTVMTINDNVNTTINNLKSYLRNDNSLSMWPQGNNEASSYYQIYVLHFLMEAKNQGYVVPNDLFNTLKNHQYKLANQWNYSPDYKEGELIQAYRLYVLALCEEAPAREMNRFKELKHNYPESKYYLAMAYSLCGKSNTSTSILPVSFKPQNNEQKAIQALSLMVNGSDVKSLVDDICATLNQDRWYSTFDLAQMLVVVGKYAQMNNVKNSSINATLSINNTSHDVLSTRTTSVPLTPKNGKNKISITNKGKSPVNVSVYTRANVAEHTYSSSNNNLEMKVVYKNKSGNVVSLENVASSTDLSAVITVKNPNANKEIKDLALTYYLPSGFTISSDVKAEDVSFIEKRDDRVYVYFGLKANKTKTITIPMTATNSGCYVIPAIHCEDMYDNSVSSVVSAAKVVVK